MTFSLCFWVLMLIWLATSVPGVPDFKYRPHLTSVILFLLLVLLGWQVFGKPIHQ